MCSFPIISFIIIVMLIIILINSLYKQQTINDVLNKLSLGFLKSQVDEQDNIHFGYADIILPDGTKFTLSDGRIINAPPNSKLIETRTDIILQMGNGDLFIVPPGTTISIPQNNNTDSSSIPISTSTTTTPTLTPTPDEIAQTTVTQAENTVTPATFINKENFNNKLEEEDKINSLSTNYMEDLLNLGLEKTVREQHKEYTKERNRVTNTAGFTSVRDDAQDIVNWVGLKRPTYDGVNFDPNTARTIPTEMDLDSLPPSTGLRWGIY